MPHERTASAERQWMGLPTICAPGDPCPSL